MEEKKKKEKETETAKKGERRGEENERTSAIINTLIIISLTPCI